MNKILDFLAKQTGGDSYKSFKYCFESVDVPTIIYDDKQSIIFSKDKIGETDKNQKTPKPLLELAKQIHQESKPLFQYFLDGSRRTYKVDDIAYDHRLYPVMAGQIGVGCCERQNADSFKVSLLENQLVLSLPTSSDKDNKGQLFFNALLQKLNSLDSLQRHQIAFQKVLNYKDRELKEGQKYEHRGIATIQDEMIEAEKRLVKQLVQSKKLNAEAYLLKDGSLEYGETGSEKDFRLSVLKSNYQCVVGVSKSFNPELVKDKSNRSIAQSIADLPVFHRTPAYKYETDVVKGVKFSVWYLRIREVYQTISPFDGILKVEKVLVTDKEQKEGLDTEEIDRISANLINERNPTCYGADLRWANHLYPVYLTENFVKSKYLSDSYFINLF